MNTHSPRTFAVTRQLALQAAEQMDWFPVVRHEPCFHVRENGSFCGRRNDWRGHEAGHEFVSLSELIKGIV